MKTIVNIVSLGHSGSTVLGNILGSHTKVLHIGEVVAPLIKKRPIICRDCLDNPCPIWGGVLKENDVLSLFDSFQNRFQKNKSIFKRNSKSKLAGNIYIKLFKNIPELDIIVDSSKNIEWYKFNSNIDVKIDSKYIFLKRNVNGVVASYKRSYDDNFHKRCEVIKQNINTYNTFYQKIPESKKIVIEYENLNNLELTISNICDFLNINFENEMLNFNEFEHHLIGGNQANYIQKDESKAKEVFKMIGFENANENIAYYKNIKGFEIDERWKKELALSEIDYVNQTLNSLFLY